MSRRLLAGVAALPLALAPAGAAHARTTIHPYIEVQQVFSADLSGNGDAVTYTGLGAGVDVSIQTRRLQAQLDYRYDHYFSWRSRYRDGDIHNGLATASYAVTPQISLNGAAIATRARGTLAQSSPGLYQGDFDNSQQVWGAQVGPSYAGVVGPVSLSADYRFGYVKTDYGNGVLDLGPGQPRLDNSFSSTSHRVDATAALTTRATGWPVGIAVSGGYIRDNVNFLDAHYDGSFARGDVTVPVTPTFAVVGGVGYERNRTSQAQILVDADGSAILTAKRRLQADHSRPRLLLYDQDGLIWDVGVLWRPSPRLSLEARGGRRYGNTAVTGSLSWRKSESETVQVVAYNDVQSFGRQLTTNIGTLPTSFSSPTGSVPINLDGCVFGAGGGGGGCLTGLASINSNFYRSRGVYGLYSMQRGRWTFGVGASYDHRRYIAPNYGQAILSYDNVTDDVVTVNGLVGRELSPNSTIAATAYVAWYDTSLLNSGSYTTYGVTGTYSRRFTTRLVGQAAVSIYSGSGGSYGGSGGGDGYDNGVIGSALLALRYQL